MQLLFVAILKMTLAEQNNLFMRLFQIVMWHPLNFKLHNSPLYVECQIQLAKGFCTAMRIDSETM